MSVSWVSNWRHLITPEISVDLVVFKIVRRVWRVIRFLFYLLVGYVLMAQREHQMQEGGGGRTFASSTLGP